MIRVVIGPDPIPPVAPDDARSDDGAELIFHGRVRDREHDRPIVALEYEQYEGMAQIELERLAAETIERHGVHDLFCTHRVGRIGIGEASLQVVVWSRHRAEGIAAMTWFVRELKRRVPIWKWAITAEGERFPSHCDHEHED